MHLAAKVDVVGPWREYARTNVDGTRRLLAAARDAGVGRFVHVSSPSVAHAGDALVGVGAGPADPARARGHYARSKALAERAVLDGRDSAHGRRTRRTGTRNSPGTNAQLAGPDAQLAGATAVVVVRPHLVWGPGDTQLVGRIVARARAGRLAVVGTGAALIDTTYVDDAVDALVAALDRAPDLHGRVLVVSGGEPRPVAELLASICAAAGVPAPRLAVPARLARVAGAVVETLAAARPAHDPVPRRAAVHRALVRPARDARRARLGAPGRARRGFPAARGRRFVVGSTMAPARTRTAETRDGVELTSLDGPLFDDSTGTPSATSSTTSTPSATRSCPPSPGAPCR